MTERWIDVVGFEGYEVSDNGAVVSHWERVGVPGEPMSKWHWAVTKNCKPVTIGTNWKGYRIVQLRFGKGKTKVRTVHTLMLEAFVGPRPEGHQGRHLDDNKENNKLGNLAWGTQSRNQQERSANGCSPRDKLTPDNVREIRAMLASGMSQTAIGIRFGIHQSQVSSIKSGRCWSHV